MNSDKVVGNDTSPQSAPYDVDATLRLIAGLPAPEGLEDRVNAKLRSAPRHARILEWPERFRSDGQWMRNAAAAAIAFVVVGGGWGVYSRVQPAKIIAMPSHISAPGSFSSGGAMRTPQTITGPVLTHPATAKPRPDAAKKQSGAQVVAMPGQGDAGAKAASTANQ
jgi:hypothetical protein